MSKLRNILTNWRGIMLLIVLLFAIIAISPNPWADGVTIKSVEKNSSASLAGIENPKPTAQPLSKERVLAINGVEIHTVAEYYDAFENVKINQTLQVKTTNRNYQLKILPEIVRVQLNETITFARNVTAMEPRQLS